MEVSVKFFVYTWHLHAFYGVEAGAPNGPRSESVTVFAENREEAHQFLIEMWRKTGPSMPSDSYRVLVAILKELMLFKDQVGQTPSNKVLVREDVVEKGMVVFFLSSICRKQEATDGNLVAPFYYLF
jgi:hypothetical protein